MRVVAIVNQKGGAGKSTTVMNLAAVAAENARVLVVDVDPQRSVTTWATAGEKLPSEDQPPFDVATETDPSVLKDIRQANYDLVFVDTPGSLDNTDVIKVVVDNSDFVVMPTEPAALALFPLMNTYRRIVEPSELDYRVVVTRVDSRSRSDAGDAQEMLRDEGLKVCKSFVRSYKMHERAPILGQVVTKYENSRNAQKAAGDYKDVALELFSAWSLGERK